MKLIEKIASKKWSISWAKRYGSRAEAKTLSSHEKKVREKAKRRVSHLSGIPFVSRTSWTKGAPGGRRISPGERGSRGGGFNWGVLDPIPSMKTKSGKAKAWSPPSKKKEKIEKITKKMTPEEKLKAHLKNKSRQRKER